RDVHALAVDLHVVVAHELASLRAARREAHAMHDVVEAALDQAEHLLTGTTLEAARLAVVAGELTLEQAVDAAHLLLLAQAQAVLAELDPALAVLARRI